MSSIGTTLLNSLRSTGRPGDFCAGGIREPFMPTIDIDGVGAFPILPVQAARLAAIAEAATLPPFRMRLPTSCLCRYNQQARFPRPVNSQACPTRS